jgi:hypothetical protein
VGAAVGASVGATVALAAGAFEAGAFVASAVPSSDPQAANNETLKQTAMISTKTFFNFIDIYILSK